MQTSIWAIVHAGKIELTEPADLPEGARVLITLMPKENLESPSKPLRRRLGTLHGTVKSVAPDFDAPLDDFQEYMA